MKIKVEITIDKCQACKHLDHTGGFTEGGAKPCCNHRVTVQEKGFDCFKRVIPYGKVFGEFPNRQSNQITRIPNWCPLKRGYTY